MSHREQLVNLRDNIAYLYSRLEDMRREWHEANAPCCPGCMFGQRWQRVSDAIVRRLRYEIVLAWKVGECPLRRSLVGEFSPVPYDEPGGVFNLGRRGVA